MHGLSSFYILFSPKKGKLKSNFFRSSSRVIYGETSLQSTFFIVSFFYIMRKSLLISRFHKHFNYETNNRC